MLKKKFSWIWLLVIAVLIASTAYFAVKSSSYEASVEQANDQIEQAEYLLSEIYYLQGLGWELVGKSMNEIAVYDKDKKPVPIQQLLAGPKLAYVFSQETCWTCVMRDIAFLEKVSEVIGKDRIVIIGKRARYDFLFKSDDFKFWRDHLYRSKLNLFDANIELHEMSFFIFTDSLSRVQLANYSSKNLDASNELLLEYLKNYAF
jgi:hypothetical protein